VEVEDFGEEIVRGGLQAMEDLIDTAANKQSEGDEPGVVGDE
jgi:hypothetical protein